MADQQVDPQTADTPPASELGLDHESDGQADVTNTAEAVIGNQADGTSSPHANSQLSLSYDGSEMEDFQQDVAESQPAEATVLKSKIMTPSTNAANRGRSPTHGSTSAPLGISIGALTANSDTSEGWGNHIASMPPAQLQQIKFIQAQQQAYAARAASGRSSLRHPVHPWPIAHHAMPRKPHGMQQQIRMAPHVQGQPWGQTAAPMLPKLPTGWDSGRPLSEQEFIQMKQLGVPILPMAGGPTGHTQQHSGRMPPPFPMPNQAAGSKQGAIANGKPEAPLLGPGRHGGPAPPHIGAQPPSGVPPSVSQLPLEERLKIAEERRLMQAELNRLTRENAVLEARVRARSEAEAGRGRGRGRGGRGRGRHALVLKPRDTHDTPPQVSQIRVTSPNGTSSQPAEGSVAAQSPADASTPAANTAEAKAKEMQQLKAKIAALEKRKAQRQASERSPTKSAKAQSKSAATSDPNAYDATAGTTPATATALGQEQQASGPADTAVGANSTPAVVFNSEDWDDGDAGWPPPEDDEPGAHVVAIDEKRSHSLSGADLLQPPVASGSLSAGIDDALPSAEEASRRRHKRKHGEEKKHKRDRSDRSSQEDRKDRKRRERSSRQEVVPAGQAPQGSSGDLRSRLESRRKRSRFAPETL